MSNYYIAHDDSLCHFGIMGMKWGIRRYQNSDGTLTSEGRIRYGYGNSSKSVEKANRYADKAEKSLNKSIKYTDKNNAYVHEIEKHRENNEAIIRKAQSRRDTMGSKADKYDRKADKYSKKHPNENNKFIEKAEKYRNEENRTDKLINDLITIEQNTRFTTTELAVYEKLGRAKTVSLITNG